MYHGCWGTDGLKYRCKKDHINATATANTRPISETNWSTYWVQDNNSTGWYIGNWTIDKDYFQKKYIKELGYKFFNLKLRWKSTFFLRIALSGAQTLPI